MQHFKRPSVSVNCISCVKFNKNVSYCKNGPLWINAGKNRIYSPRQPSHLSWYKERTAFCTHPRHLPTMKKHVVRPNIWKWTKWQKWLKANINFIKTLLVVTGRTGATELSSMCVLNQVFDLPQENVSNRIQNNNLFRGSLRVSKIEY